MENPYIPNIVEIENIIDEVPGERAIKTFRMIFQDEKISSYTVCSAGSDGTVNTSSVSSHGSYRCRGPL